MMERTEHLQLIFYVIKGLLWFLEQSLSMFHQLASKDRFNYCMILMPIFHMLKGTNQERILHQSV